jgi:hypothetical protein
VLRGMAVLGGVWSDMARHGMARRGEVWSGGVWQAKEMFK